MSLQRYRIALLASLTLAPTLLHAAQHAQTPNLQEEIIREGNNIELWDYLVEKVIQANALQEGFDKTSQEWVAFFEQNPMLNDQDKRFILSLLTKVRDELSLQPEELSLQHVRNNDPITQEVVAQLLACQVQSKTTTQEGDVTYQQQSLQDALTTKALTLAEQEGNATTTIEILPYNPIPQQAPNVKASDVRNTQATVEEVKPAPNSEEPNYLESQYTYYALIALVGLLLILLFSSFFRKRKK